MTDLSSDLASAGRRRGLARAVHRNGALSRAGLSERLFTLLFSGLVYPQIWEDPDVDMAAMALGPGHRVVTIASGGCNVLAYLTRDPAAVDAVDLNRAHIALNRLKLTAVQRLPGHGDLLRMFGGEGNAANEAAYHRFLAPHLDVATRAYWEGRTWRGRRRIGVFGRNFYRTGLLGAFIAAGHRVARLYGVDVGEIMAADTLAAQRRFFEQKLAPLFERRLIKQALARKASLFGLGIPPAQYDSLVGDRSSMAAVLSARLEKLACDFPLADNYFAWQAFARRYPNTRRGAIAGLSRPRSLRHDPRQRTAGAAPPCRCRHAVVAQGSRRDRPLRPARCPGLDDRRSAQPTVGRDHPHRRPGARVIFRTAAEESLLPGRVSPALLGQWRYQAEASQEFGRRDRSGIYGGFHLYEKIG